MALFSAADRHFAEALSHLAHCNPFLPCRIEYERAALGAEFQELGAQWNVGWSKLAAGQEDEYPNVRRLSERSREVLERARARLAKSFEFAEHELLLYEDLVLFDLYHRHRTGLEWAISDAMARRTQIRVKVFDELSADAAHWLRCGDRMLPLWNQLPHMAASFFQIRRAFHNIFNFIIGSSRPMMRLRAAVWESIFTHDMRRYRRLLFDRMTDYTTLITGPSGTGKELVARAVGLSRYIPFDAHKRRFAEDFVGSFFPLNLSALSPTLIESELFGHRRGAFTGAIEDRRGWLEACPPQGTVFLDEIGELDPAIQVKLLRVLQQRTFSRLGETDERTFQGKLIAATNRDLAIEMHDGRFRDDLYYRLCSDMIATPSLGERLADDPSELHELVMHMALRLVGDEAEAVAKEVLEIIETQLGPAYPWPGNVRELEQCVRNVLVRKQYRPRAIADPSSRSGRNLALSRRIEAGQLTAEELLRAYCTLVYNQTGSYEATARRLKLDRRTVKAKVDPGLLDNLERPAKI